MYIVPFGVNKGVFGLRSHRATPQMWRATKDGASVWLASETRLPQKHREQILPQTVAPENIAATMAATTCCTLGVADSGVYPNTL